MGGLTDAAVAFTSCAVGGIAGPVVDRLLPSKDPGRSVVVGDGSAVGSIDMSSTTIDKRIYVTVEKASRDAELKSRPRSSPTNRAEKEDEDPWLLPVGLLVGTLVAVGLYFRYQPQILTVVTAFGCFSVTFVLSALIWARLKKVRFERRLRAQSAAIVILGLCSFVDIWFLVRPPFYEGADSFRSLVEYGHVHGLSIFEQRYGLNGTVFIAYQMFGLLLAIILLLLVNYTGLRLIAAAIVVSRVEAGKQPGFFRRFVGRGGSAALLSLACLVAILSVVLTSGALYRLLPEAHRIERISPTGRPTQPAPTTVGPPAAPPSQ